MNKEMKQFLRQQDFLIKNCNERNAKIKRGMLRRAKAGISTPQKRSRHYTSHQPKPKLEGKVNEPESKFFRAQPSVPGR